MLYKITKITRFDSIYDECGTEFIIDFTFEKQKCNVSIKQFSNNINVCKLKSNTDGYHWLNYWLSQEPNSVELIELDDELERNKVKELFAEYGINYRPESKETSILIAKQYIDESFVKIVADIIEPRFANRDRFFED